MEIFPVASPHDLETVKDLFREYFAWIDRELKFDMGYQKVESELLALPGSFAPPAGCLLIAAMEGQAAGCIALRPLEETVCEMKRMYVRPQFRGKGLGKALCERLIIEAKTKGYRLMRLDTEMSLAAAIHLYLSLGFKVTQAYYAVPPENLKRSIFMELPL
jgi:putative acetyltransferase